MDRLRRSLRNSFRRRSGSGSLNEKHPEVGRKCTGDSEEGDKSPKWSLDEASVRAGTCSFKVKYLGCVEVYESRGMQVCEEALKVLRLNRRRPAKAILYVSGDSIRVVDKHHKGLIVDQTIEKVSFCSPDRYHEKGFAYICRDGTTRRWLCYGFHARKDTGERLSHAVGCAFAVCLEKKQKRDREAQRILTQTSSSLTTVTKSAPDDRDVAENRSNRSEMGCNTNSSFQRHSFRYASLQERILDPQNLKPSEAPPLKSAPNPHAVARPRGNFGLFERQGSLRTPVGPAGTSGKTPFNDHASDDARFRRFRSLRVNELPSNVERAAGSSPLKSGAIAEEEDLPPIGNLPGQSSTPYNSITGSNFRSPSNGMASTSVPFIHQTYSESVVTESEHELDIGNRSRGDEWLQTTANQAKFWQQVRTTSPCVSESTTEPDAAISITLEGTSSQPPPFPPPPLPHQAERATTASGGNSERSETISEPASSPVNAWTTFDDNPASTSTVNKQATCSEESAKARNIISSKSHSAINPFSQESSAIHT